MSLWEMKKSLSKEDVLEQVNQFDIFNCYCSPFIKLNKSFRSEIREDKKPTCSICRKGQKLIYKDFGETGKGLDCFDYMMKKYNITFMQALQMINLDFNLKLMSSTTVGSDRAVTAKKSLFNIEDVSEEVIEIQVRTRPWSIADKTFWNGKYGIHSQTLNKFRIYPLEGFFINGRYTRCGSNVYGYYFGKLPDGREAWKIYQPYATKDLKWRSNCPENIIQGWEQLTESGDLCIITKSLKDVVVLHEVNFNSVAPQAESNNLNPKLIENLRTRFKHVILLYDNDNAGKRAADKLSEEHNLPVFFMPSSAKDASDYVELYNKDALRTYISNIYGTYSNDPTMGS